jgi:hypothetical protein
MFNRTTIYTILLFKTWQQNCKETTQCLQVPNKQQQQLCVSINNTCVKNSIPRCVQITRHGQWITAGNIVDFVKVWKSFVMFSTIWFKIPLNHKPAVFISDLFRFLSFLRTAYYQQLPPITNSWIINKMKLKH